MNKYIWPLNGIQTFENTFPECFNPTMGIPDATAFDFNISPTVSKGNVNINLSNCTESSVGIFNTLGQQVFQNKYSEKSIHLNLQLVQGVNMVKVTANNNSVTKIIIIK